MASAHEAHIPGLNRALPNLERSCDRDYRFGFRITVLPFEEAGAMVPQILRQFFLFRTDDLMPQRGLRSIGRTQSRHPGSPGVDRPIIRFD